MGKTRVLKAQLKALRELINERDLRYGQRFQAAQEAVSAALAAAKEAVTKAESANERRFESVNEFRAALTDQSGKMITRFEADTRFKALEDHQSQQRGAVKSSDSTRTMIFAVLSVGIPLLLAIVGGFVVLISRLPPP